MGVEISEEALSQMRAHAAAAHPQEACGILLGEGGRITAAIEARNLHASPKTHFEIDPQALIDAHRAVRAGGTEVLGYYHSHPTGPAAPSATDRACASGDGKVWAILAGEDITFWRDGKAGFTALPFSIAEG